MHKKPNNYPQVKNNSSWTTSSKPTAPDLIFAKTYFTSPTVFVLYLKLFSLFNLLVNKLLIGPCLMSSVNAVWELQNICLKYLNHNHTGPIFHSHRQLLISAEVGKYLYNRDP